MPESRLARTRDAYLARDPIQSLARVYLQHASGLIRDGRGSEAIATIEEAVRILRIEPNPIAAALVDMAAIAERYIDPGIASLRPAVDAADEWMVSEFIATRNPDGVVGR